MSDRIYVLAFMLLFVATLGTLASFPYDAFRQTKESCERSWNISSVNKKNIDKLREDLDYQTSRLNEIWCHLWPKGKQ